MCKLSNAVQRAVDMKNVRIGKLNGMTLVVSSTGTSLCALYLKYDSGECFSTSP